MATPSVSSSSFPGSIATRSSLLLEKVPGTSPEVPAPMRKTFREGASNMDGSSRASRPGSSSSSRCGQWRNHELSKSDSWRGRRSMRRSGQSRKAHDPISRTLSGHTTSSTPSRPRQASAWMATTDSPSMALGTSRRFPAPAQPSMRSPASPNAAYVHSTPLLRSVQTLRASTLACSRACASSAARRTRSRIVSASCSWDVVADTSVTGMEGILSRKRTMRQV